MTSDVSNHPTQTLIPKTKLNTARCRYLVVLGPEWTTAWSDRGCWPGSPPAPAAAGCLSRSVDAGQEVSTSNPPSPGKSCAAVGRTHLVCEQQVADRGVLGILHHGADDLQHGGDACRETHGGQSQTWNCCSAFIDPTLLFCLFVLNKIRIFTVRVFCFWKKKKVFPKIV